MATSRNEAFDPRRKLDGEVVKYDSYTPSHILRVYEFADKYQIASLEDASKGQLRGYLGPRSSDEDPCHTIDWFCYSCRYPP